jgi:hypothetical protein
LRQIHTVHVLCSSEENSSIPEVGVDMLMKAGYLTDIKNGPVSLIIHDYLDFAFKKKTRQKNRINLLFISHIFSIERSSGLIALMQILALELLHVLLGQFVRKASCSTVACRTRYNANCPVCSLTLSSSRCLFLFLFCFHDILLGHQLH